MEGCFPLAPSFDHAVPIGRDIATCARMMEALVPSFGGAEPGSLEDARVLAAGSLLGRMLAAQLEGIAEG
jgi:Asp-tRNA(Asn)/Glu-tRNA(Gln) amidotransferase A subunit family amidase